MLKKKIIYYSSGKENFLLNLKKVTYISQKEFPFVPRRAGKVYYFVGQIHDDKFSLKPLMDISNGFHSVLKPVIKGHIYDEYFEILYRPSILTLVSCAVGLIIVLLRPQSFLFSLTVAIMAIASMIAPYKNVIDYFEKEGTSISYTPE